MNVVTNSERILQVTSIDVSGKNDPTVCDEIGYFINLEELYCNNNELTSLDVSNNKKLTKLHCFNNELSTLCLLNNPELVQLWCNNNYLTSLDLSSSTKLEDLSCYSNQLTLLDVSNNTKLYSLYCDDNQLTSLNVDNNKKLNSLYCGSNKITILNVDTGTNGLKNLCTLDVSNCTSLEDLSCYPSDYASGDSGSLTSLNVRECTKLSALNCGWNQLTSLDLSTNTALLWGLTCHNNLLKTVDITKCTKLRLSVVYCGSQWTDEDKTTSQPMTLYYSSQNTGTFNASSANNTGVTPVKQ